MTHNVTECQRRLIALGYLAPGQDDGKFGAISLAAYNHYRAAKGFGPVNGASMAQLDQDLFPEDYRTVSNPLDNPIVRIGLGILLNRLTKGLIPMNFTLTGYKTYIIAAALVVIGGLHLVGIDIPGFDGPTDIGTVIATAIGLVFARNGAKTEANKVSGQ